MKGTKMSKNHSENKHHDICYGRRLRVMLNGVQCIRVSGVLSSGRFIVADAIITSLLSKNTTHFSVTFTICPPCVICLYDCVIDVLCKTVTNVKKVFSVI